jgi:hypothetical protein
MKKYAVTVRSHTSLVKEVTVEAANTFMAHKAALALHPHCRIVRIAPALPESDGEDW